MSLIENLMTKAVDSLNDEESQKEWVESGFDKLLEEGRSALPATDETELKAVRESGEYALGKLEKHKSSLVRLGQHGLRSTLSLLALGDYDKAAEHAAFLALRETASWDEVSETIRQTADEGNQKKREIDAEVAAIKEVLKDIGVASAKALLPILLAVI